MDEEQAQQVAEALGGEPWNSGGEIWLVLCRRGDGRIVAISDDVVCEYANEDALDNGIVTVAVALH